MAFRVIQQSLWTDEKVLDCYSCEDKYFWLYLLTNPQSNQLGIYKLPLKLAAFQLGYSKEQVIVLLDRFEKTLHQIKYNKITQEIAIGNFLYHSVITGGKPVINTIEKDISKVTDNDLFDFVIDKLSNKKINNQTVLQAIELLKEKSNKKENIKDKEQNDKQNENENENDNNNGDSCHDSVGDSEKDIISDKSENISAFKIIIDYLNLKAGTKYKYTSKKTKSHINARLEEGFTVEDFKTVIDKKCSDWLGDPKFCGYIRPETLFGTKFESYLNQKEKPRRKNEIGQGRNKEYADFGIVI